MFFFYYVFNDKRKKYANKVFFNEIDYVLRYTHSCINQNKIDS